MKKYEHSIQKGLNWVLDQQNDDGSMETHDEGIGYYKVPYLFSIAGKYSNLHLLMNWVRENYFTSAGDFNGDYPRGTAYKSVYTYPNTWIVSGAQKGGEFDIASRGMDYLETQQGEEGGFYAHRDGTDGGRQELMCSAMGGVAALYTGRLETAKKVADLTKFVYEEQPSPDEYLYFSVHPDQGLVTDFPEEEASEYVIDLNKDVRQWYFVPGIASAFLTLLYKATDETSYLELAKDYLEFSFRCSDYQFNYGQVCKVGWGASMLYSVTGKERYKDLALRVADYFVDTQREDGHWAEDPDAPGYAILDLTAEFTVWLKEIVHYLS